jgi:methylenetetrahydrofolate dehydrogenase (NADP+)/methenyltetrahydrofolate cyclohydrolase
MSAQIIDGKAIGAAWRARAAAAAGQFAALTGRPPGLAVVLVGDDPASEIYVRNKHRDAQAAGMVSVEVKLPADISQDDLEGRVRQLGEDPGVDGVLLQLPLPAGLDAGPVLALIPPDKDVDGLTHESAGRLVAGAPGLRPCTPQGCVILARETLGALAGRRCVVVGRSILVGKPAALMFLEADCTVTIAHSRSADLAGLCRTADILVPAVGRPEMVRGDWIKPGACVIDVGINRVAVPDKGPGATRVVGDVAFGEAVDVAGAITPVPGGVGPMTIACLLANTARAAFMRAGRRVPDILTI